MAPPQRGLHARDALVRHALHQADVDCARTRGASAELQAGGASGGGLQRISSHSTTVPWMEKKGRPTLVCQFWGDLRMRLFSVSRILVLLPA